MKSTSDIWEAGPYLFSQKFKVVIGGSAVTELPL